MQGPLYLATAAVGLCVGSFLAAYTFRKQKGLSVFSGRSSCPRCQAKISWFDNLPIVSFLLLKGKCRACSRRISLRYPVIEFSTMVVFLVSFRYFLSCGDSTGSILCSFKEASPFFAPLVLAALISILMAIMIIDIESKIIPDELVFSGILILLPLYLLTDDKTLFPTLFVAFAAAVFFLLIHLMTRGRGMGLGDVKFVILGGLLLGWPQTLVWLFLAFLTGAVFGSILILLKKAKFGQEIAFGPYLAGTLLLTVIFGEKIINAVFY